MIDTEALRKKIIDLAIRGKLTEQFPSDGDAEDLYVQIQEEKNKLINEKKIKKEKQLPDITTSEIPFEIPSNWKWIRIGNISSVISKGTTPRGGNVAYLDSGIGFLRVENLMGYDKIDKSSLKFINEETHNGFLKRSILEDGDILISIAGTLGRTGLVRKYDLPLNTNQAIAFIRLVNKLLVDGEYLAYILNSITVQKELGSRKVAMAIPNLSLDVISKAVIPIPPLTEQRRIVEVLRNSFDILDVIDDFQAKYNNDLKVLKNKVIDAGIRGKLTEQLPSDGDAETLYAQIQAQKLQLIKEGKMKKEKPLPDITADEIPFEIPKNWKWARIGKIFTLQAGRNKISEDIHNEADDRYKYPCYGGNGLRGYVDESNVSGKHILIGRQGALCGNINIADNDFWATEHAVVVYQYGNIDVNCYEYMFRSLNLNQYATSVAQPGLAVGNIEKVLIPLPPLSEQKRIATKIQDVLEQLSK